MSICLVGKYTALGDAYTSVVKALQHASIFCNRKLKLSLVESEDLEVRNTFYLFVWQAL